MLRATTAAACSAGMNKLHTGWLMIGHTGTRCVMIARRFGENNDGALWHDHTDTWDNNS
jgi:hypothetical protein